LTASSQTRNTMPCFDFNKNLHFYLNYERSVNNEKLNINTSRVTK